MTGGKYIGYTILVILLFVVALPLLTSIIKFAIFAAVIAGIVWLLNRAFDKGKAE